VSDVTIVGGGLAGLVCAADLARAGVEVTVLEASDGVGGRVRTDVVDGFRLDRGFQILLTAYPQVKKRIDVEALGLGRFVPGAIVRADSGAYRLSDPLRRPGDLIETLRSPVASWRDKLRTARLVLDVTAQPVSRLLHRHDVSTAERLAAAGLSPAFVRAFWRPLFAGIQLDPELEVSSRRFELILRMLATGSTGLPREGIGALPRQVAARLPGACVRLGVRVARVRSGEVQTTEGERIESRIVVVAADGPTAHSLLPERVADPGSRPVACCWYSMPERPGREPYLLLDGTRGPALNAVVISDVQPSYAPAGRSLVAAAVPGPQALVPGLTARVQAQLAEWFGIGESDLTHLRTDVIPHGQPDQRPPLNLHRRVDLGDGLFVCGDHRDTASTQGAMFSGERTAAAVLRRLRGTPAS
jgi:phytoene dehydrogenase-like protein